MRKSFVLLVASVPLLAGALSVCADTVIESGPGNIQGDQNILFKADLVGSGTSVQGATNQTDTLFDFTSSTTLNTPSNGQAKITASGSHATFSNLSIRPSLAGSTFTSLIFNADAAADGHITITANPVGETPVTDTFNLSKNGQNFFEIIASNDEKLSSVSFTTTAGLSDVSQVRIGGIAAVPVPTAAWGGAMLLGGMVAFRLRNRARVQSGTCC